MSSIFNGDKTIIIGGHDGNSVRSSTWIFDHSSGTFDVKQPEMTHGRAAFGCSTFKSGHHKNRHVVVVAGSYDGDGINTAELFDYETQSATWELVTPLPRKMYRNRLVSFPSKDASLLIHGE